jgi:hypothetical protein
MTAAASRTHERRAGPVPALRRDAIPEAGWPFLGLAQRLGVYEDDVADAAVARLTDNDKRAVLFFRSHLPVEVDQWLRGDEAMGSPPSSEYVAFACLYLAADYLAGRP